MRALLISSKGVSRARFSASDHFSITRTGDDRHEGNEKAPAQLFPNLSPVLSSCATTCQPIRVAVLRPSIILCRLRDALWDVDPWLRQLACGDKMWRGTATGRTTLLSVRINCNLFHGAVSHWAMHLIPISWAATSAWTIISSSFLSINNTQALRRCVC